MAIIQTNIETFEETVINYAEGKAIVVAFDISPELEKQSEELKFDIAKLDPQDPNNQQLAAYMQIRTLNDIRIFKDKQMVGTEENLSEFFKAEAPPEEEKEIDLTELKGLCENTAFEKIYTLASEKKFQEALDSCLEFIENKQDAKKQMVAIFAALGPKHELTWEYRAKLNRLIYV